MILKSIPRWLPILLILAATSACKRPDAANKKADAEPPTVSVRAATATRGEVTASYVGTASLEPEARAEVVAKVSGMVLEILVEEGDTVKAGQLMARIDEERYQLELNKAKATLDRLVADHRRAQELFAKKLLSSEDFERIRFDLDSQRAGYELIRLELSYARVVAPISGVVARRNVKVGNLVQINQNLFQIDNFDPLWGVLNVPERELAVMRVGLPAILHVDALGGRQFEGRLARVSPVVDPSSGTFRVTTEFRDADGHLASGMFGRLEIIYDRRDDVLTVPREALIEEDGLFTVFRVEDGVAKQQSVLIGYQSGQNVEIREGLQAGDQVVTIGRAALRDGTKVEMVPSATAPVASPEAAPTVPVADQATSAAETELPPAAEQATETEPDDGAVGAVDGADDDRSPASDRT